MGLYDETRPYQTRLHHYPQKPVRFTKSAEVEVIVWGWETKLRGTEQQGS